MSRATKCKLKNIIYNIYIKTVKFKAIYDEFI